MHPPDILLVNPWIYDFAAYDLWARPLGLLTLGARLRKAGYRVAFLDALDPFHPGLPKRPRRRSYGTGHYFRTPLPKPVSLADVPRQYARYGMPTSIFHAELKRLGPPRLVLVTSLMTYWYPGVLETIRQIKRVYPDVPVLLGGIYATLCYEHARENSGADWIWPTVAEEVLELIKQLLSPSGETAPHPYPVFDLQRKIPYVVVATSYGCPFSCKYCASRILRPGFKQRPPKEVFEEIRFWHQKYGVRDFAFYDDALLINFENHLGPLLEMLLSAGLKLRFHTPNALHLRFITREVAHWLRKAGFVTLRFGLETIDFKRHQELDRKVYLEEFLNAVHHLREVGFSGKEMGVYLLWGLPEQNLQEVWSSALYVAQHGVQPHLAEYSPIPRTPLFEEACKVSRYPLREDPIFHNNSCFPCIRRPDWKALEDLKQSVRKLRARVAQLGTI